MAEGRNNTVHVWTKRQLREVNVSSSFTDFTVK